MKLSNRILVAFWGFIAAASCHAAAFEFGACIHLALGRSDAAAVLQHLDGAGMTSLRDDIYWSSVEHDQGQLQFGPKYDQLKQAVQGMAQRSKSTLLILAFGNKLYDNGGLVTSPEGIAAFANYAGFVVRSFGDAVNRYEVWNEWNSGFGSNPKVDRGSADAYVRLLAATAKSIKQANPRAMVVGGVTAGVELKWWREFIAADGLSHLDAISVHSYTLFRFKENPEGAIRSLDQLRALVVEASPNREIPILVTEMGWPTNRGKHGVSERDAAKYLVRFMMLARSRPWIGGVWWYDLFDDGDSNTKTEHRFGLVTRDLRLKPAYIAARDISKMLLVDSKLEAFRTRSGGYVVTGSDAVGRWTMGWNVEPGFLEWADGQANQSAAPDALESLSAQFSSDGFPTLFRQDGSAWRPDADWSREYFRRASSPPAAVKVKK